MVSRSVVSTSRIAHYQQRLHWMIRSPVEFFDSATSEEVHDAFGFGFILINIEDFWLGSVSIGGRGPSRVITAEICRMHRLSKKPSSACIMREEMGPRPRGLTSFWRLRGIRRQLSNFCRPMRSGLAGGMPVEIAISIWPSSFQSTWLLEIVPSLRTLQQPCCTLVRSCVFRRSVSAQCEAFSFAQ